MHSAERAKLNRNARTGIIRSSTVMVPGQSHHGADTHATPGNQKMEGNHACTCAGVMGILGL